MFSSNMGLNPLGNYKMSLNVNHYLSLKNRIDNIYSATLLAPLMKERGYFPVTTSAMQLCSLNLILNDIVINNRKTIIEFGSGITTIFIARLIKDNHLDSRLYSIDENKEWLAIVKKYINNEETQNSVDFIWADLKSSKYAISELDWYDEKVLEVGVKDNKFDMVIVDGPSAWKPEIEMARYPAIPFMCEYLSESFSIFLDDTNRTGEQNVVALWKRNFGLQFAMLDNRLAACFVGDHFNIKL